MKYNFNKFFKLIVVMIPILVSMVGCNNSKTNTSTLTTPEEVFLAFQKALSEGDLRTLKQYAAAEQLTGFKKMSNKDFRMVSKLMPKNVTIAGSHVSSDTATFTVQGDGLMGKAAGTVSMTREKGLWKVKHIEWKT